MNLIISGIVGIIALVSGYFALTPTYDSTVTETEDLGAVSYPTSLDTFTNPSATDRTNVVSHSSQHSDANDAIEALEAKVGADGSAVTTSHDYKLSGVTGSDKAVSLAGSEVLTNKTLTAPTLTTPTLSTSTLATTTLNGTTTANGTTTLNGVTRINLGSDATGDTYYRDANGNFVRLPIGSADNVLKVSGGLPAWSSNTANAPTGFVNATSSASTSLAISVDGTNFVQVFAYGSVLCSQGAQSCNPVLKFGSQTVDSFESQREGNGQYIEFSLMWFATPSATTTTLSLADGGSNISSFYDATIVYFKY